MSQYPSIAELNEKYPGYNFDVLVEKCYEAASKAYTPYSKYKVGCALLTHDDQIITGCNIENASFGLTNCAERTAIFKAVSAGTNKFKAVVVSTRDGGSCCGACRQVLREFIHPNEMVPIVVMKQQDNTVHCVTHIDELLPWSFGPENLDLTTGDQ